MNNIQIHHSMDNAEYHDAPAIGSSGLKLLQRSPLHYWSAYRDPNRIRKEPTPLMRIGTAWHAAIFEPEKFKVDYIELPEGLDRRTKEGKALYAEIEASGREPLASSTMTQIKSMAAAAAAHPVSRVLFEQCKGYSESSMFWVDAETGTACKIRPDFHVPPCAQFPHGLIVDGKSIDDASADSFGRNAWNGEHHLQGALYVDGFQRCYGTQQPPAFIWLVQERDAPYATAYYSAASDLIEYGRKQYKRLLAVVAECERTGEWPGYPTEIKPMAIPTWAAKALQEN
jgi:exodeoxyribonuclease VIII